MESKRGSAYVREQKKLARSWYKRKLSQKDLDSVSSCYYGWSFYRKYPRKTVIQNHEQPAEKIETENKIDVDLESISFQGVADLKMTLDDVYPSSSKSKEIDETNDTIACSSSSIIGDNSSTVNLSSNSLPCADTETQLQLSQLALLHNQRFSLAVESLDETGKRVTKIYETAIVIEEKEPTSRKHDIDSTTDLKRTDFKVKSETKPNNDLDESDEGYGAGDSPHSMDDVYDAKNEGKQLPVYFDTKGNAVNDHAAVNSTNDGGSSGLPKVEESGTKETSGYQLQHALEVKDTSHIDQKKDHPTHKSPTVKEEEIPTVNLKSNQSSEGTHQAAEIKLNSDSIDKIIDNIPPVVSPRKQAKVAIKLPDKLITPPKGKPHLESKAKSSSEKSHDASNTPNIPTEASPKKKKRRSRKSLDTTTPQRTSSRKRVFKTKNCPCCVSSSGSHHHDNHHHHYVDDWDLSIEEMSILRHNETKLHDASAISSNTDHDESITSGLSAGAQHMRGGSASRRSRGMRIRGQLTPRGVARFPGQPRKRPAHVLISSESSELSSTLPHTPSTESPILSRSPHQSGSPSRRARGRGRGGRGRGRGRGKFKSQVLSPNRSAPPGQSESPKPSDNVAVSSSDNAFMRQTSSGFSPLQPPHSNLITTTALVHNTMANENPMPFNPASASSSSGANSNTTTPPSHNEPIQTATPMSAGLNEGPKVPFSSIQSPTLPLSVHVPSYHPPKPPTKLARIPSPQPFQTKARTKADILARLKWKKTARKSISEDIPSPVSGTSSSPRSSPAYSITHSPPTKAATTQPQKILDIERASGKKAMIVLKDLQRCRSLSPLTALYVKKLTRSRSISESELDMERAGEGSVMDKEKLVMSAPPKVPLLKMKRVDYDRYILHSQPDSNSEDIMDDDDYSDDDLRFPFRRSKTPLSDRSTPSHRVLSTVKVQGSNAEGHNHSLTPGSDRSAIGEDKGVTSLKDTTTVAMATTSLATTSPDQTDQNDTEVGRLTEKATGSITADHVISPIPSGKIETKGDGSPAEKEEEEEMEIPSDLEPDKSDEEPDYDEWMQASMLDTTAEETGLFGGESDAPHFHFDPNEPEDEPTPLEPNETHNEHFSGNKTKSKTKTNQQDKDNPVSGSSSKRDDVKSNMNSELTSESPLPPHIRMQQQLAQSRLSSESQRESGGGGGVTLNLDDTTTSMSDTEVPTITDKNVCIGAATEPHQSGDSLSKKDTSQVGVSAENKVSRDKVNDEQSEAEQSASGTSVENTNIAMPGCSSMDVSTDSSTSLNANSESNSNNLNVMLSLAALAARAVPIAQITAPSPDIGLPQSALNALREYEDMSEPNSPAAAFPGADDSMSTEPVDLSMPSRSNSPTDDPLQPTAMEALGSRVNEALEPKVNEVVEPMDNESLVLKTDEKFQTNADIGTREVDEAMEPKSNDILEPSANDNVESMASKAPGPKDEEASKTKASKASEFRTEVALEPEPNDFLDIKSDEVSKPKFEAEMDTSEPKSEVNLKELSAANKSMPTVLKTPVYIPTLTDKKSEIESQGSDELCVQSNDTNKNKNDVSSDNATSKNDTDSPILSTSATPKSDCIPNAYVSESSQIDSNHDNTKPTQLPNAVFTPPKSDPITVTSQPTIEAKPDNTHPTPLSDAVLSQPGPQVVSITATNQPTVQPRESIASDSDTTDPIAQFASPVKSSGTGNRDSHVTGDKMLGGLPSLGESPTADQSSTAADGPKVTEAMQVDTVS